jgi:hypothetical protein
MSDSQAVKGLSCPRCGGMVSIPEGQAVVVCPFCDLRSVVSGERGVRRYQVPARITREQAVQAYQKFLRGNFAISMDAASKAQISEVFQVHLPFWAAWGRGLGWVLGRKKVGSGDNSHYEPREVRVMEDMDWNGAACDVGEFGVQRINLAGRPLEPFDVEALHRGGMVFEPVGSVDESREESRGYFESQVRAKANLDQISQSFVRILRQRSGLVYYPLWVLRYLYRGRSFQVVVDGFSGEILYGKAPGNVLFRAGVLVGGMALGAFVAIDLPALFLSGSSHNSDGPGAGILLLLVVGFGLMYASYRRFRYGEHYEYRRYKELPRALPAGAAFSGSVLTRIPLPEEARDVIAMVQKFQ